MKLPSKGFTFKKSIVNTHLNNYSNDLDFKSYFLILSCLNIKKVGIAIRRGVNKNMQDVKVSGLSKCWRVKVRAQSGLVVLLAQPLLNPTEHKVSTNPYSYIIHWCLGACINWNAYFWHTCVILTLLFLFNIFSCSNIYWWRDMNASRCRYLIAT